MGCDCDCEDDEVNCDERVDEVDCDCDIRDGDEVDDDEVDADGRDEVKGDGRNEVDGDGRGEVVVDGERRGVDEDISYAQRLMRLSIILLRCTMHMSLGLEASAGTENSFVNFVNFEAWGISGFQLIMQLMMLEK